MLGTRWNASSCGCSFYPMTPNERLVNQRGAMDTLIPAVTSHYARSAPQKAIWAALEKVEGKKGELTIDDLAPVDEYHIRGRAATEELVEGLDLDETARVLDIGCGLGGACRFVAATYGSTATGVDLSDEYCRIATALTQRVGLEDRVHIQQGNALSLPVDDAAYDVALSQHVQMNIADKRTYAREIARVLKPGGRLALYEICAGEQLSPHYPVPWADDASISFLAPPEELRAVLSEAGLDIVRWEDTTAKGLAWFEQTLQKTQREGPPPLGLHLLMGTDAKAKMKNVVRNLAEDRITIVRAVARKAAQ